MAVMPTGTPATAGEPVAEPHANRGTAGAYRFAALSFGLQVVLGLGSAVVSARLYGVGVIGEFALVSAPWLLLVQLSTLSEQTALVRALSLLPARDKHGTALFYTVFGFSSALTLTVAVAILGITRLVLGGPIGRPGLFLPTVALITGYLLLDNVSWNLDMVFSSHRAGRDLFLGRSTQAVVLLIGFPLLALVTSSVWGLVIATLLSFAVSLAVRVRLVRRYMRFTTSRAELAAGRRELPELLRFGLKLVPGAFAGGVIIQVAIWILASTAPVVAVGAYSRAANLAQRINDAGYRITEILFPTLVRHQELGGRADFDRTLNRALTGAAIPLVWIPAVGGGAAAGILSLLFGKDFTSAREALALLLVFYSALVVSTLQDEGLTALGHPSAATRWTLVRAGISLVLLYPAAELAGASGIAAAFVIGVAVAAIGKNLRLRSTLLDHVQLPGFGRQMLMTAVAGGVAFAASRWLDTMVPQPIGVLVAVVGGTVVYAIALTVLKAVPGDDVAAVRTWWATRRGEADDSSAPEAGAEAVVTEAVTPVSVSSRA